MALMKRKIDPYFKNGARRHSKDFFCTILIISQIFCPKLVYCESPACFPANKSPSETSASVLMMGLKIKSDHPLQIEFFINRNNENPKELSRTSEKLANYFLAALTVSPKDLWVNLSPYEKDRIIPSGLERTLLGKTLLEQDYLLKQSSASLMNPNSETGQRIWGRLARSLPSGTDLGSFNKVWIIPDRAIFYTAKEAVLLKHFHLKVLLENDYLSIKNQREKTSVSLSEHSLNIADKDRDMARMMREELIPILEKEVNEGKNFTELRQLVSSTLLAMWYRKNVASGFLSQKYCNQEILSGIDHSDPSIKESVYQQYVISVKNGVFNFIQETIDPITQTVVPTKYFSGGILPGNVDADHAASIDLPNEAFLDNLLSVVVEVFPEFADSTDLVRNYRGISEGNVGVLPIGSLNLGFAWHFTADVYIESLVNGRFQKEQPLNLQVQSGSFPDGQSENIVLNTENHYSNIFEAVQSGALPELILVAPMSNHANSIISQILLLLTALVKAGKLDTIDGIDKNFPKFIIATNGLFIFDSLQKKIDLLLENSGLSAKNVKKIKDHFFRALTTQRVDRESKDEKEIYKVAPMGSLRLIGADADLLRKVTTLLERKRRVKAELAGDQLKPSWIKDVFSIYSLHANSLDENVVLKYEFLQGLENFVTAVLPTVAIQVQNGKLVPLRVGDILSEDKGGKEKLHQQVIQVLTPLINMGINYGIYQSIYPRRVDIGHEEPVDAWKKRVVKLEIDRIMTAAERYREYFPLAFPAMQENFRSGTFDGRLPPLHRNLFYHLRMMADHVHDTTSLAILSEIEDEVLDTLTRIYHQQHFRINLAYRMDDFLGDGKEVQRSDLENYAGILPGSGGGTLGSVTLAALFYMGMPGGGKNTLLFEPKRAAPHFKSGDVVKIRTDGNERKKIYLNEREEEVTQGITVAYANDIIAGLKKGFLPEFIVLAPMNTRLESQLDEIILLIEILYRAGKIDSPQSIAKFLPKFILSSNGILYEEFLDRLGKYLAMSDVPQELIATIKGYFFRGTLQQTARIIEEEYIFGPPGSFKIAGGNENMRRILVERLGSGKLQIHDTGDDVPYTEYQKGLINFIANVVPLAEYVGDKFDPETIELMRTAIDSGNGFQEKIHRDLTPGSMKWFQTGDMLLDPSFENKAKKYLKILITIASKAGLYKRSDRSGLSASALFADEWQRLVANAKHHPNHMPSSVDAVRNMFLQHKLLPGVPALEENLIDYFLNLARKNELWNEVVILSALKRNLVRRISSLVEQQNTDQAAVASESSAKGGIDLNDDYLEWNVTADDAWTGTRFDSFDNYTINSLTPVISVINNEPAFIAQDHSL